LRSARTRGPITFGHPTSRTALSARPSVDAVGRAWSRNSRSWWLC